MHDLRHRNFGSAISTIDQATSSPSSTSGILQYETGYPILRTKPRRILFYYYLLLPAAVSIIVLLRTISTSISSRNAEEGVISLSNERRNKDRTPDKNIYQEQLRFLHQSNAAQPEKEEGDAHLLSDSVIGPPKEDSGVASATIGKTEKTGISLPLEETYYNDQDKTNAGAKHPLLLHYSWTQPSLDISWNSCHLDEILYYSDDDVDAFVQQHRPSFYPVFRTNLTKIEKMDYFRYLVIYIRGGFWVDADVECLAPVDTWLSKFGYDNEKSASITSFDFVVGLEFPDEQTQYAVQLPFQLTQYTLGGRANSQTLLRVLEYVEHVTTLGVTYPEHSVLQRTGPVAFTKAILDEIIKNGIPPGIVANTSNYPLALSPMSSLNTNGQIVVLSNGYKKLYSGIILPYRAFSFHELHNTGSQPELTKHNFWGSWRDTESS